MISLKKLVHTFEANTGFDTVRFRGLPRRASLAQKIEAFKGDVRWIDTHTTDACQKAMHGIGQIETRLENKK